MHLNTCEKPVAWVQHYRRSSVRFQIEIRIRKPFRFDTHLCTPEPSQMALKRIRWSLQSSDSSRKHSARRECTRAHLSERISSENWTAVSTKFVEKPMQTTATEPGAMCIRRAIQKRASDKFLLLDKWCVSSYSCRLSWPLSSVGCLCVCVHPIKRGRDLKNKWKSFPLQSTLLYVIPTDRRHRVPWHPARTNEF